MSEELFEISQPLMTTWPAKIAIEPAFDTICWPPSTEWLSVTTTFSRMAVLSTLLTNWYPPFQRPAEIGAPR